MLLDGDSLYYTLNNTALMRMPKAGGASELVLQGHGTWNRPNITVFGRDLVFVGGDSLIRYNLDTGATASIPWDFRAPVDHIGSAAVAGDRLVVMRGECNDILVYDANWTEQLHVVVHTEDYMGGVISNFHVDGDVAWCASSQHMKLFKINLLTGESQVWLTLNKNDAQGLINGFRAAFTLGTDLFAAIGMINEPGVYRWARVPGQGTYEMVGPDVPVGAGNTAWDSTTQTLWSVGGAITRWSPTTLKVFKADLKLTTHGSPESIDTGVLADTYAYFYFSDGLNPNPAEVKRIFRIKRDAIPWVEQTAVSFLWAPP